MIRRLIIAALGVVLVLLVAVPLATAKAYLSVESVVKVGDTIDVSVCDTGGRLFQVRVTYPDGSELIDRSTNTLPTCDHVRLIASQPGIYLVELQNKNGSSTGDSAVVVAN